MKATYLLRILSILLISILGISCTTTTDRFGHTRQTLTPEGAILGAVAVGLVAYGVADRSNNRQRHHRERNSYHRHNNRHHHYAQDYHGGYYGQSCR